MGDYILEHVNESNRLEFQSTIPQYSLTHELKRFRPFEGSRVLDLGCGTGLLSRYLAEQYPGIEIDACDYSDIRLAEAKNNSRVFGHHKINFFRDDIEQLSIEDNTYDFVIIRYVLEHLKNPLQAVSEARRILRPGGQILVIDFDGIFVNLFTDNEELNAYLREIEKHFTGDLRIGHKIPNFLKKTHFHKIDHHIEVMQFKGHEAELELCNNRERFKNCFKDFSRILGSEERAQRLIDLYLSESVKEGNVMCFNKYIVTGHK